MFYDQASFDIRCEWGLSGVRLVGNSSDVLIVVDALSFSTCVDIAVSRGGSVFPYRWKGEKAAEYAAQMGAELAGSRGEAGKFSLSPTSMLKVREGTKIVLPSPNGSELATEAAALGCVEIAGCFRNSRAVAEYAITRGVSITVIPCGERWPDGTLRLAVEDLAAAGAIIASLPGAKSPEAMVAAAAWDAAKMDLAGFLKSCASGCELIERGFDSDVELAGQVNVSRAVPILMDQACFIGAPRSVTDTRLLQMASVPASDKPART